MPSPSLVIFTPARSGKAPATVVARLRDAGMAPVVVFPDKVVDVDGLIRAMAGQVERVIIADGEQVGVTPAEFSVAPEAINIYAGETVADGKDGDDEAMLREEWEIAAEDILVNCHEQADLYADTATHMHDPVGAERCRELGQERRRMAEKLGASLRKHGVLPRVPDPDKEAAEKWLDNFRARFSGHETESLLRARMESDVELRAMIESALAQEDMPADIRDFLGPGRDRIAAQIKMLAAFLQSLQGADEKES